ncbi:MAG: hypothetical protein ACK2TT_00595 [Anaerolineales bacterium]
MAEKSELDSREYATSQVREWLGDDFLVDFFRRLKDLPYPRAVSLINQELDEGRTLDEIFSRQDGFGFYLRAWERDEDTIDLEFGYVAGPLAGDGASYVLTFSSPLEYTILLGGIVDF